MEPEWEPVDTWHARLDCWMDRLPVWARFILLAINVVVVFVAFLQAGFYHRKM